MAPDLLISAVILRQEGVIPITGSEKYLAK